jgi:hypothetical protein
MTLEERRECRRASYQDLTESQRQNRRAYQREFMRRKRAAAKAAKTAPDSAGLPDKVRQPETRENATESRSETPAQANEKELSPRAAQKQHRLWRTEVVTFFEDMLTDPRCPLSGQDFSTNRTFGFFFGIFDRLNQIENIADNTDQLAELRLSVAIECLRRLTGETPAGAAPESG